jgi:transmembrane sensor
MEKDKQNLSEPEALLIRCLDGSASDTDYSQAWEWIQQNEQNKRYYEQMRDVWLSASVIGPGDENGTELSWIRFKNSHLNQPDHRELTGRQMLSARLNPIFRIAAAMVIAFLIGGVTSWLFSHHHKDGDPGLCVIEAPRGAKSFITLPDGTRIWLNAGSKISYQRNYNQQNRNITLEGEAYFNVSKNKDLPFFVYSSGLAIRAIGTSFNVKAYPDEDIIETTLVEGKISIESTGKTGRKEKIFIEPNQKASFYKVSSHFHVEPGITQSESKPGNQETKIARIKVTRKVNTEIYTSWKDKRWVFKKQKMSDFAVILERLYDVKIIFKDEELKQYSLSGSFEEENLEQVLKAIQLTVPMDYTIQHKEVIFTMNKQMRNRYEKLLKPATMNENP